MDRGRVGVELDPAIEPALLPARAGAGHVTAPALRMRELAGGAPGARGAGPPARIVVATGFDETQQRTGTDGRGIDLERGQFHSAPRQLVVEGKALRRARAAERHLAGGDGQRRAVSKARQRQAARRGQPERGAQPGKGFAVHVFMEQREPMEIRVGVRWRHSRDAGLQLLGQTRMQLRARGQRRVPAQRMREPGRIEQRVGAGDARRRSGMHIAIGRGGVRAAQNPELGKPGDVGQLPRQRVDAGLARYAPLVVVEVLHARPGKGAALAQRRDQRRTVQGARVLIGGCGGR